MTANPAVSILAVPALLEAAVAFHAVVTVALAIASAATVRISAPLRSVMVSPAVDVTRKVSLPIPPVRVLLP